MAAGTTPIYPATPKSWQAQVTAANTNRDGSGSITTVVTGGSNGTKIDRVRVKATVTTTAGLARLWISLNSGTTWRLYTEITVSAITVSASTAAFESTYLTPDLLLPDSSALLGATMEKAEATNFIAHGADY
ncbi:MAG: hypothetical protein IT345_15800 [Trueperaceae bacterium]|nr:hypothetical protein [Trueperaceae bacterium]